MGFCDCAPSQAKELQVLFLHKKVPYLAIISDQVGRISASKVHTNCSHVHELKHHQSQPEGTCTMFTSSGNGACMLGSLCLTALYCA